MQSLILALALSAAAAHSHGFWSSRAAMPGARSDFTATVVGDDAIVVVGGCDSHQIDGGDFSFCPSVSAGAHKYAPASNEWTALAAAPRARFRHAAAFDGEHKILYVVGGRDVGDGLVAEVDAYDVATDSWSTVAGASVARSDLGALFVGGYLVAAGGYDAAYESLATTVRVDLGNGGSSSAGPALSTPRGDFGLVAAGDVAYAIGGWSHGDWCNPLATVETVPLEALAGGAGGGWSAAPSLAVARGDKGAAAHGETVYVVGGEHNNGCASGSVPVDDVEALTNGDEQWTILGEIPDERFRFAAAVVGNTLYTFGGQATMQTACPDSDGAACWPVNDHVWALDLGADRDADADDDDDETVRREAFVAVLVLLVTLIAGVAAYAFKRACKTATPSVASEEKEVIIGGAVATSDAAV